MRDKMQLHAEDTEVQHRRLTQLINELASFLSLEQRRCPGARRLLVSLISFSEIHFSDQEEFMKHNKYPEELRELHASAHREFLARLHALHDKSDPEMIALGQGFIVWTRAWMEDHIFTQDQAYLDHFRREFRI